MSAAQKLQPVFLDPLIQPTISADAAFCISGLERAAKFVAMRAFLFLPATDDEEATIEIRKDLIKVLFCPSDLEGHHTDIALSQLKKPLRMRGKKNFSQLDLARREVSQDLMNLLVLGGGVAGIADGKVVAGWGSSSFREHLKYDRPEEKCLADRILGEIKTLLYPIFNLTQI